jgi:hypothetical protein
MIGAMWPERVDELNLIEPNKGHLVQGLYEQNSHERDARRILYHRGL